MRLLVALVALLCTPSCELDDTMHAGVARQELGDEGFEGVELEEVAGEEHLYRFTARHEGQMCNGTVGVSVEGRDLW